CHGGMTVLDVGANIGLYTALAMHSVGPNGRVIAIEPHPESIEFLKRTIAANATESTPYVKVVELAAASKEGSARLFLNLENKGDNSLHQSNLRRRSIEIRTASIDSILAELGIASVDLLKIDIQGAEFDAILGARRTIKNSARIVILSEFWPQGLQQSGA